MSSREESSATMGIEAKHKNIGNKKLAIAIMGPTAAGKTALSIDLAKQLNGEIISVDSALVYRGLDIGSAKPSMEERAGVPHHLIDIREPHEPYSAADFCKDAKRVIDDIVERGKTPMLVGGTMMYVKSLLEGLSAMPPANETIRSEIESFAEQNGWPAVHQELQKVDPISAEKIHPNHSQRLSRALEVYRITGIPFSSHQEELSGGLLDQFDWVQIAVGPRDRHLLHQRIAQRFQQMLDEGFLDEVRALKRQPGLHKDLPAIRSVGYRQAWEFLDGEYENEQEFIEKGLAATRQLAKRQLTWLRGWPGLEWLDIQNSEGKVIPSTELSQFVLKKLRKRAI